MPGTERTEPATPTYEMDMEFEELLRHAEESDHVRQEPPAPVEPPRDLRTH